jgi:Na+/melibiose symporter-like transporter
MLRQIRPLLKNGPFRIVLLSSVCGALAGSVNASVAILFYDHVAGIGEEGLVLILVLFTAALAGTPLWVRLGARLGKHKAIALAGLINMGAFAIIPFIIYGLKPLDAGYVLPAMFAVTIVRGATMSASGVLGMSILADVADLDTLKTGEQRTGFLFSFLGMVRKIFEAAGVGIALPIVSWFGFNPRLEENSDAALFSLLAMYCLLPLLLWLASIAIIWRYPITPARQERLRRALRLKEARRASHSAAS